VCAVGGLCAGLSPARRERIAGQFTAGLLHKLDAVATRWPELVNPADLPMVRQVVDRALTGREDALAWRDQAGPVPDSEHRAMTAI
jgi:hypothetical protein